MSAAGPGLEYRRLRAPRTDRTALIEPAWSASGAVIAANQARAAGYECRLLERTHADLSAAARRELVDAALEYTRGFTDAAAPASVERVVLAGHQPELFHPGVWFKNIALDRMAREHGAAAVNLVIDSDTAKHAALRVPGGDALAPSVELMPFDAPTDEIPFEQRPVVAAELFASFGRRVAERIRPLVREPLIAEFWPMAVERKAATGNLGAALSQSRRQYESRFGSATLELPQSAVCELEAFRWFTAHVLHELPRFVDDYNRGIEEYRLVHGLRSANHPAPNLSRDGEWLEAPFWLWTAAAPRRRRAFVARRGRGVVLADRRGIEIDLPLGDNPDGAAAAARLAELPGQGIKLRSRALATTLFGRLLLGDLFIHGIGGAKYDQLNDLLMRRFFGVEPPEFYTISATLLLPVERPAATAGDLQAIDYELRELTYHPEAALDVATAPADVRELAAAKRRWLATPQSRENGRERCRAIRGANEALQSWVAPLRAELLERRERIERQLRAASVVESREYAFCLFPEATLRDFFVENLSTKR